MKDKKFDKIMKEKIRQNRSMPEEINQLFSNFEKEIRMEKTNKLISKLRYKFRYATIVVLAVLVVFIGGNTYAHMRGNETIISPLLRRLGINNNYEENYIGINKEVENQNITIKILDAAIDETTLIVGYKINIPNNDIDDWIEIDGIYSLNNIYISPINYTIDKTNENEYIYYQIFDMNEIEIENRENITFKSNIVRISRHTEYKDESYSIYEGNWIFEEDLEVKNITENKTYEFKDMPKAEVVEGVNVYVTEFVTGSYTNILKIKTDKTNYEGDDFYRYYKIFDENNEEIIRSSEEERNYDISVYSDRIPLNISKDSKIKIEIYLEDIINEKSKKVASINVDLSKAIEKKEMVKEYCEYKADEYKFKYNKNWDISEIKDTNSVGLDRSYLIIKIPSTTNSYNSSSIEVETINEDYTQEEYIEIINESLNGSPSETLYKIDEGACKFSNSEGYQITSTISDGNVYINKDFFTIKNGKVYRVIFFGSEMEYYNLKSDLDKFIENFEINE